MTQFRKGTKNVNTELIINLRKYQDVPVVALSGDVDSFTSKQLQKAIVELVQTGKLQMIINVAKVHYIDSSGLGTLIGGLRRVNAQNGRIAVAGPNSKIQKVLNITGLSKLITLYDSDDAAVRSLKA